ncbi:MAG: hypothetical protein HC788_11545 [Sphingopyxis sp.]|nr:hypothetical protein [Sphingopyxis sp.]
MSPCFTIDQNGRYPGGAKYATSEAFVRSQSIETWDRGYAENGEQVWGSKAGPYRFMKVSERPPLE